MLVGKDIYLRPFRLSDAEELLELQRKNRSFFEQFSMTREDRYYTLDAQKEIIEKYKEHEKQDIEYQYGIFKKNSNALIGTISLFQVVRGPLQSAFIGYFLDKDHNGKGYTTEAVTLIVNYSFEHLKLHRIEAGVMPHNFRSIRVLEKAGFHTEGLAKKNVNINGRWEDHQVLAIINPND